MYHIVYGCELCMWHLWVWSEGDSCGCGHIIRYDSRVKAMEVDEKPTETYNDIGGLDKQIEEVWNEECTSLFHLCVSLNSHSFISLIFPSPPSLHFHKYPSLSPSTSFSLLPHFKYPFSLSLSPSSLPPLSSPLSW